jgi:hypothetical protein
MQGKPLLPVAAGPSLRVGLHVRMLAATGGAR